MKIVMVGSMNEILFTESLCWDVDAHIPKYPSPDPLLHQLRNLVRRDAGQRPYLIVDAARRMALNSNAEVQLTRAELTLLIVLGQSAGAISRHRLLAMLHPEHQRRVGAAAERLVDFYIFGLRRKLETIGCTDSIVSVRTRGYKWLGPPIRSL
jgi:DNA-binding response OmpR family regulator